MNRSKRPDELKLSVVIIIASDTTNRCPNLSHLGRCLEALTQQVDPPSMEIIVPYHLRADDIKELKLRFPEVVFLLVDDLKKFDLHRSSREHHDELRARGLAAARGEIIGLLEDHALPDPNWCTRVAEAHRKGYVGVGGSIENGTNRPLNWAVYFCDFGKYQNPVPEGESSFVSDANASYKRSALESIRPVWQESFNEPAVNWALTRRGEKLALSPKIIVHQHRGPLRLGSALKERFIWGRSYAATRTRLAGSTKRMICAAFSPMLPGVLLLRMTLNVMKKGRCKGVFLKVLPLTTMLTMAWSLGELVGYLTGLPHSRRYLVLPSPDQMRLSGHATNTRQG
jgi:hypothetical protein